MKSFWKTAAKVAIAAVVVALVASLTLLILGQFNPTVGGGVVSFGDTEMVIDGLFENTVGVVLVVWLAVGAAFFVALVAVALAVGLGLLAVAMGLFTGLIALASLLFIVLSPFIVIGFAIWFAMRKSKNGASVDPSAPSVPPPAAA